MTTKWNQRKREREREPPEEEMAERSSAFGNLDENVLAGTVRSRSRLPNPREEYYSSFDVHALFFVFLPLTAADRQATARDAVLEEKSAASAS